LYFDIPTVRWPLFALLGPLGLRVEAHLVKQYSPSSDVLIAGKQLHTAAADRGTERFRPRVVEPLREISPTGSWIPVERRHHDALIQFISHALVDYYDGLDESFVASLLTATEYKGSVFDEKGKFAFVMENERLDIAALCVLTPKRGGSLKLGPLCFDQAMQPQISVDASVRDLLTRIAGLPFPARKLYSVTPLFAADVTRALRESGFRVEGVLQEPYRVGADFLVCGRDAVACSI